VVHPMHTAHMSASSISEEYLEDADPDIKVYIPSTASHHAVCYQ